MLRPLYTVSESIDSSVQLNLRKIACEFGTDHKISIRFWSIHDTKIDAYRQNIYIFENRVNSLCKKLHIR